MHDTPLYMHELGLDSVHWKLYSDQPAKHEAFRHV